MYHTLIASQHRGHIMDTYPPSTEPAESCW